MIPVWRKNEVTKVKPCSRSACTGINPGKLYRLLHMKKRVNTCANNNGGQEPGHCRTVFLRRRVNFHRHPREKPQSLSTIHPVAGYRYLRRTLVRRIVELSPSECLRALPPS